MSARSRFAVLASVCTAAFGGTVVVPTNYATAPGNGTIGSFRAAGMHFQEVVGGGQFPGAILITGLRVRAATGTGPFSTNLASLKLTLSTTQAYPNTVSGDTLPSLTYANNVGPDATVVYNAGFSFSSPGCTAPGPCPFDMAIAFTKPFPFDRSKGRLLVDMVTSAVSGTPAGTLDAATFPNTTTSSVVAFGGDPTQAAANTLLVGGYILGLDTTTPLISSISNAATNIVPGLPNAPIAQGAIFVVKGSGLGPATISIAQGAPFQSTTLSGTSVSVTVGTISVNVPMYYTSDGQVAALLPSNTPAGNGTLTVVYNTQTSPAATITVVANNLGVFTIDSSGQGPGIVTYPDYSLVSPVKATNCGGPNTTCGAANPGDTLILWATGLGPISGSDASGAGLGQNMPNVPLTLWIGGVQANVSYQGRSGCCIGEDQIVFTVPMSAPTGCAVPMVVQINTFVSNTTLIPVASGSRNCTPVSGSFPPAGVQLLTTAASFNLGDLELDHFLNNSGQGYFDQAKGGFFKISGIPAGSQLFVASFLDNQPIGTCTVFTGQNSPSDTFFNSLNIVPLDAGSSFTVSGPNGSMTVAPQAGGGPALLSSAGAFLVPGDYTITGSGGKDVGPFTAKINIPVSPKLTSPNSSNFTVTRSKGMTVTWNANGSAGHVEIVIVSGNAPAAATLDCTAPASAGTFTIPTYALYALPTGTSTFFGFQLGDESPASAGNFTATGVDAGVIQTFVDGTAAGGFTIN